MARPEMIVVAGPAGSGKSLLFPVDDLGVDGFNLDDRAAAIHGSYQGIPQALRASLGQACERFVDDHIARRLSFAVETTLRTEVALEQARRARDAGFLTMMVFVGTHDPAINVERVRRRGRLGGHAAPATTLVAIYEAAMVNLQRAVEIFEKVRVYDNSVESVVPAAPCATLDDGLLIVSDLAPQWVRRAMTPRSLAQP